MSHEILVLSNGEQFTARDIAYSEWTRHQETYPCHLPNGNKGEAVLTVDMAEVRFNASAGPMAEGDTGQMSISDDRFHEVNILSVEETTDGLIVTARARKTVEWKFPDPPDDGWGAI
jgi:hypothetical protein